MPLYEFLCSRCGHKSERLCRGPEETAKCPVCGGTTRRVLSTFRAGGGGGTVSTGGGG